MTAFAKITHKLQDFRIVQLKIELFSFEIFGHMNAVEYGF